MEDFLNQIENALEYNLYYIALQSTLTLPDICSSLISATPTKRKVRQEYVDWYTNHFKDNLYLSAEDCYYFRCANVHQAKTIHANSNYSRILFIEPQTAPITIHNCIINDVLCIDVNKFCKGMISSVRSWINSVKGTEPFETNYKSFIKRYPNGLPPYVVGIPIIS